jgi:hypothetical protein
MNCTAEKSTTTVAEAGATDCSCALNAAAVARSTSPATTTTTAAVEGVKECVAEMLIEYGFLAHRGFDGYRGPGQRSDGAVDPEQVELLLWTVRRWHPRSNGNDLFVANLRPAASEVVAIPALSAPGRAAVG